MGTSKDTIGSLAFDMSAFNSFIVLVNASLFLISKTNSSCTCNKRFVSLNYKFFLSLKYFIIALLIISAAVP